MDYRGYMLRREITLLFITCKRRFTSFNKDSQSSVSNILYNTAIYMAHAFILLTTKRIAINKKLY